MGNFRRSPILMAAFSQMHRFFPGKSSRSYDNFVSILENAKIANIFFLRHGKTAPSTGLDFDRQLTDEGRKEALQAGCVFGKDLKPFFSPVLVSPAPRTMDTAELFFASSGVEDVELRPIQSLYDGTMQPKGSVLFQKLGYAPLRDYLSIANERERHDAQNVLGSYAHSVVETIMETAEVGFSPGSGFSTLCLVAHAIYLPAAALGVASVVGCDNLELLLETNTREAEGFLIDLNSRHVEYLSREN